MNRILITGGAGFIGINTAHYYLQKGIEVIILDNFSRKGSRENIEWLIHANEKKPQIIQEDIVAPTKQLEDAIDTSDIVFHFASQVAVTSSIENPMHDFQVNALGTMHILETIRKSKNNPILLYSSTNKVYGDLITAAIKEKKSRYTLKELPFGIAEDYPMSFKSPYGCSKGTGDQYVHDYHGIYGLRTIVFRQSCIYGPHQFGIEDQGWIAWFIIAILFGKKITIYGNGKQVRDLLYIDDLIRAFDLAISRIGQTNGQIYNIGGGMNNNISIWTELKPLLETIFNKKIKAELSNERPGDQKIFFADIRKAKKDFGWEPQINIPNGIEYLFDWVKKNRTLLEKYFQ